MLMNDPKSHCTACAAPEVPAQGLGAALKDSENRGPTVSAKSREVIAVKDAHGFGSSRRWLWGSAAASTLLVCPWRWRTGSRKNQRQHPASLEICTEISATRYPPHIPCVARTPRSYEEL